MKKILARGLLLVGPLIIFGIYFWGFYSKEKTIIFGESVRKYRIHVPLWPNRDVKLPLVVALHGYADHPRFMELYSGWSSKADRERFIVVYPYGTKTSEDNKLSWNAGSCCGEGLDLKVDDVNFISGLIEEVVKNYPVDTEKIFLSGFSNGALLSYRIAAENPGRIKAVGVVGGSIGGKRSQDKDVFFLARPARPMNVIMIHGDRDTAVPYDGGSNYIFGKLSVAEFSSFRDSVDFWLENNSCETAPITVDQEDFERQIFMNCSEDGEMEAFRAKGRNHVWPGGLLEFLVHGSIKEPSATDEMWRFFSKS